MKAVPIYRAKKINSDEYSCGYLIRADDYEADADEDQIVYFIMHKMENYRTNEVWDFVCNSRIDPSTLSIHFPDMLDSQGNKIFASLQEDGKGGDVCSVNDYIDSGLEGVAIYQNYGFRIDRKGKAMGISLSSTDIKIIGIQQWS